MPLLPPSEMLYSNSSSKALNLAVVTRSPASCGSAQTSNPLLTCQPGRTPSRLKLCQPAKSTPLNNNLHPAARSSALNTFRPEAAQASSCCFTDSFHSSFNSLSALPVNSRQRSSVYLPWRQAALTFAITSLVLPYCSTT